MRRCKTYQLCFYADHAETIKHACAQLARDHIISSTLTPLNRFLSTSEVNGIELLNY
jgi:hypothetical protein